MIKTGNILEEIRIRTGHTLRNFCLSRDLDANRYSLIERDILRPNVEEVNQYLKLIKEE